MRLSVIIPIYKVERYIERCLLSLVNQNIDPETYEIICINDGSPDRSGEIVKCVQRKHRNVKLIEQENQGVSSARNNGMNVATGKYLLFIDPDDYIELNSLKRVLDKADNHECQVAFLGFTVLTEAGEVSKQFFNDKYLDTVFKGTEAYFVSRGNGQSDPDRMWAVLLLRDFIEQHQLRYLPDVPYLEDGEFIARILCLVDSSIFEGGSFYYRTIRKGISY
jgi:glycosyltransferase involved in cell wall biosynthesis